jgi:hypothetical protein
MVLGYPSGVKRSFLSFSLFLPAVELILWIMLIPTQILILYLKLSHPSQGSGMVHSGSAGIELFIPRDQLLPWVFQGVTMRSAHLVQGINLPGTFLELLVSLPTSWPDTWHPAGLTIASWQATSLPFFCLPFWWFLGRGIDAALGRRHLHWVSLLAGTILCAAFVILFLGMRFGMAQWERDETVEWVLSGMTFWAIALAVFPFVWVRQWRARAKSPHPVN